MKTGIVSAAVLSASLSSAFAYLPPSAFSKLSDQVRAAKEEPVPCEPQTYLGLADAAHSKLSDQVQARILAQAPLAPCPGALGKVSVSKLSEQIRLGE